MKALQPIGSVAAALFILTAPSNAPAGVPPTYYDSAIGKSRWDLRAALHGIIRNHRVVPYSSTAFDTSDALKVLDQDPTNAANVRLIYAQRSEPKTNFPTVWNREHLWPNSYGLDTNGADYSDLFNLRAEDMSVNTSRGNDFYDTSNTNDPGYRLPAYSEAAFCSRDSDSWEPPPPMRGDIARALMYMDVCYEGGGTDPDLILTDQTNLINSTTNLMGRLSTLLRWHYSDPVDDAERRRNDLIYDLYQNNRNPFVDHPKWVSEIFLPELKITMVTDSLRLTWPALYKDAQVIYSLGSLAPPGAVWFTVTEAPTESGNTLSVTRPQTGPITFYRLMSP